MKKVLVAISLLLVSQVALAQATEQQPDRADVQKFYSLIDQSIGLKGYDPVAYFTEAQAVVGDESIAQAYGGVIYHFASEDNRDLFNEDPAKFEPTYGGWCAWARAQGQYANIDPTLFIQEGNRMHFFISRGVQARFARNLKDVRDGKIAKEDSLEKAADDSWLEESLEGPRL